nr:EamA family transporter RarD [Paenibacillus swuensis]
MTEQQKGIGYSALSYFIWGLLPIYWKWLDNISSDQILAQRVFWAFIFMLIVLSVTGRREEFKAQLRVLRKEPKRAVPLAVASLLISGNWYIYIWAVNSGHLIEASMGYYINPLVSVLLGLAVLRERLSSLQWCAFALAGAGVLVMTLNLGQFPWVALSLALSFGLYGLAKKLTRMDSIVGLTFETLFVMPFALGYLVYLLVKGTLSVGESVAVSLPLIIGSGAVTAIPLLLFAMGAQRISLTLIGFLQYLAPTISLILGVFLYKENFTDTHLAAFTCIWLSLAVFTWSKTRRTSVKKNNVNSARSH